MAITQTYLTLTVDGVLGINVSAPTQDPNTGQFVRSIQFFDVAVQGSLAAIPKLTVIASGPTQQGIAVETPQFSF